MKLRKRLYQEEAYYLGLNVKDNEFYKAEGINRKQARYFITSKQWLKILKLREEQRTPKILIFDIETSPIMGFFWSLWKQNIPINQIKTDWFMLTWAAKWLFDDKIYSAKLTPKEAKEQNDNRIIKSLWKIIDEADVIIAHNALKFDIKRMNTRFFKNGLNPPSPYQVIDTLLHARKQFAISSNKLDYLAKFMGVYGKSDTDWSLWQNSINGDSEALKKMEEYNIQDIRVLEDVYLLMRPYIKPHPNLGLLIQTDKECCPTCGSVELEHTGSEYKTYVNAYTSLRCKNCGSISRRRKTNISLKEKRKIIVSTPK